MACWLLHDWEPLVRTGATCKHHRRCLKCGKWQRLEPFDWSTPKFHWVDIQPLPAATHLVPTDQYWNDRFDAAEARIARREKGE